MDVYWLELSEAEVPANNDWLSANEAAQLKGMRFQKRRTDWRLGRWTAKHALAACWNLPDNPQALAEIEICPATSGAPEVLLSHKPAAVTISLSHSGGSAMCAVVLFGCALGCDLERVEPRTETFVADYFTPEERELVAAVPVAERPGLSTLLWSGKESALKALQTGLRLDTRSVVVTPAVGLSSLNSWNPLQVQCSWGQVLRGWWQRAHNVVRTLVATPPPAPPIRVDVNTRRTTEAVLALDL